MSDTKADMAAEIASAFWTAERQCEYVVDRYLEARRALLHAGVPVTDVRCLALDRWAREATYRAQAIRRYANAATEVERRHKQEAPA